MKLIPEHSDAVFDVPKNGALLIGNDEDCQVQINRPEIWGRHAVIKTNDYGYVLQVESTPIEVNDILVESRCLLYAGDVLKMADLSLRLVDDDYIPKTVNETFESDELLNSEELSSVFGLRQLSGNNKGAFIKSSYQHPDGWHIYRTDARLALLANNQPVFVNGRQVDSAWLKNNDRIHYHSEQLAVECPGHSGYSKFSPSHPRNVMLSEDLVESESVDSKKSSLHSHYWWITLMVGLLALVVVILSR